tara:strand:+ start:19 stop:420 length:402 start_codon:yes stop_codon:yes gene_type:complete
MVSTGVYFIWGFKIIADKLKIRFLSVSVVILVVITVLLYAGNLLPKNESALFNILYGVIMILASGTMSIIFGVGLLKLKKDFGRLATATGVLNIISGAGTVTIIFVFLTMILLIPLAVLEIILMLKAAEKLDK